MSDKKGHYACVCTHSLSAHYYHPNACSMCNCLRYREKFYPKKEVELTITTEEPKMKTAEEYAAEVWRNSTGPVQIKRYACDKLQEDIADKIRTVCNAKVREAVRIVMACIKDREDANKVACLIAKLQEFKPVTDASDSR